MKVHKEVYVKCLASVLWVKGSVALIKLSGHANETS